MRTEEFTIKFWKNRDSGVIKFGYVDGHYRDVIEYDKEFNNYILHGHNIATWDKVNNKLTIWHCHWPTITTFSRLNTILQRINARVYTHRHKVFVEFKSHGFKVFFDEPLTIDLNNPKNGLEEKIIEVEKFEERRRKVRESLWRKALKSRGSISILNTIGIKIHIDDDAYNTTFWEDRYRDSLWILSTCEKIAVQEAYVDLFGNIIVKVLVYDEGVGWRGVRAVIVCGKDCAGQTWTHIVPPQYFASSLVKAERWLLGLNKGDILVEAT
ncbi:MAG: hypothetical protein QXT92_00050 [Nitrososphaerota archaeon]